MGPTVWAAWVQQRKLKNLAYEAEDVLGEYEYELLRAEVEGRVIQEEACEPVIPSPLGLPFRANMAFRIKKIMQRFHEIAEHHDALHLNECDGERKFQITEKPPSSSYIHESEIYGREDDKDKVIDLLLSTDCRGWGSNLSVIPIVGMGGIGKTTLVKVVYNDSRVQSHFNQRAWVCVSEDFNVISLTEAIIQSLTNSPTGLTELSPLQATLKDLLNDRRYLLVLDDVWNEKQGYWDILKAPLLFGKEGSKVVVTTRNESVARIMRTVPSHHLQCLSENDCWMLFQQCAFDGQDPIAYQDLVGIGKKIANKCGGLPLASRMLGSLLRFETDIQRWMGVLESDLWDLDRDEILPALRLGYVRLPAPLKKCFAYCSLFPKDYSFSKTQLIRLWISQDFIQPKARKEVEDVGGDVFDELVQRSFFQHTHNPTRFVMHDLILDLARFVSMKGCFIQDQDQLCNISTETRHLSFIWRNSYQTLPPQSFHWPEALRTLLIIDDFSKPVNFYKYSRGDKSIDFSRRYRFVWTKTLLHVKMSDDFFQRFGSLRALDLSCTDIIKLPDTIGNLKHLRYLGLNGTKLQMLPDSLCDLYNLQLLELRCCTELKELPKGMWKLTNLRHLDLMRLEDLGVRIYPGIGKLTHLQTLTGFDNRCVSIHELEDLVNLREVEISGLRNMLYAKEAFMRNKKMLTNLSLFWSPDGYVDCNVSRDGKQEEDLLECLEPHHSSLKELEIWDYSGVRFPSWVVDPSFSRLVHVKLWNCQDCKLLPALGQLPSLRYLSMMGMDSVKQVGHMFCRQNYPAVTKGFPSLEKLDFIDMKGWVIWDGVEDGDFPCLQSLTLWLCPKLKRLPHLPYSLTELVIWDCNSLELQDGCYEKTGLMSIPSNNLEDLGELNTLYCSKLLSMPRHVCEPFEKLLTRHPYNLTSMDYFCNSSSSSSQTFQGLHNLASLRCLEIKRCLKFFFTPDTRLPSTLQALNIIGCPGLTEWCQGHGSSQLEHIPQVKLL